jgi:iron complex transport system ATP-binding protein
MKINSTPPPELTPSIECHPILEAQQLAGGYTPAQAAVQGINLELQPGEWLSLVGANGSGKSTLLKLLSRVLKPQQGVVWLDGKAIHSQPARTIAQRLTLLPQHHTIPEGITVYQLVSLGRTPHQPWWQWELTQCDRHAIATALRQTELATFADRPVQNLSGGERQRAFLALALAQNPSVLLLDEPTTYLDIRHQLELLELLRSLNQCQRLTLITVLHDINLAARYSDRLAMLHQGCLWAIGPPANVLTPTTLHHVFGIQATLLQTPVGLQICPLAPTVYSASANEVG